MARDQNKTHHRREQAQATGPPGAGAMGQSAKDRSKAQSRPVTAKSPTGKARRGRQAGGAGRAATRLAPGSRPAAQSGPERAISGTMMAWGAVGLVIVVVAVLVDRQGHRQRQLGQPRVHAR